MARRRTKKIPPVDIETGEVQAIEAQPSLIENTAIPLSLGGGFLSALALAVLTVSFLGDPVLHESAPHVVTLGRTTPLTMTTPAGEPQVVDPEDILALAEPTPEHGSEHAPEHTPPPAATPPNLPAIDPSLLTEQGPHGPLPVITAEGVRAMDAFARPFDKSDKRPRIAIIVTGLGLSTPPSQAAIEKLPPEVTLSFVPYAPDLNPLVERARQLGHELVLEIPMEPFDYPANDPGPYALLTQLSAEENDKRLMWILSRFTGYAGVSNYLGGQFLSARASLKPALVSVQSRGLYFLDNSVSPGSLGTQVSQEIALPSKRADVVLDVIQSRQTIDDQLSALERAAQEHGKAIGVAFIYPVTIERISAWAATLSEKGFALAPVSAMLDAPQPAATAINVESHPSQPAVPDQRGHDGH